MMIMMIILFSFIYPWKITMLIKSMRENLLVSSAFPFTWLGWRGASPRLGSMGASPRLWWRGASPCLGSRGARPRLGWRGASPRLGWRGASPWLGWRGASPRLGSRGAIPRLSNNSNHECNQVMEERVELSPSLIPTRPSLCQLNTATK